MIYACYFVPYEGVHPTAKLADYEKLWKIMKRSVNALGHKLVHITDPSTENWGDECVRYHIDPRTTVMSRDIAWHIFVSGLEEGEQACMIEPDTILLQDIPPIADGYDLVLLKRPKPIIPGWFKLAKKSAAPFFGDVLSRYSDFEYRDQCFHGDITALHATVAENAHGCKIEWRDWTRYGFRKAPHLDPFLLQFKGDSKKEMLARA